MARNNFINRIWYLYTIRNLSVSNIGSFEKENVLSNKLIKDEQAIKYYKDIIGILSSDMVAIQKTKMLMDYLLKH